MSVPENAQQPSSDGRQGAYCQTHGLHFDPSESGCVLCLREQRGATEPSSRLIWVFIVLFGIAILGVAVWVVLRPTHSEPSTSGPAAASGTAEGQPADQGFPELPLRPAAKLDPEPFRSRIISLEQVLYRPGPPNLADADQLSSLAHQLGTALLNSVPISKRPYATSLLAWSGRLGRQSDVGYRNLDLASARAEWEKLRASMFTDAAWFEHSTPELDARQQPAQRTVSAAEVQGLSNFARRVADVITEGQRSSRQVGELSGDYVGPQERDVLRRWRKWSKDWTDGIDGLARRLPPQPSPDDPIGLIMAHQKLRDAIQELRLVTFGANDTGVPYLNERDARFKTAQFRLDEAARYLEKLSNRR
ncbi:MAG: hypothetical protein P8Z74_11155 [Acidobacteriota bacterium]